MNNLYSQFKFNMQWEMHKHMIKILDCMLEARARKDYDAWLEFIDSLYSRISGRCSKSFREAYIKELFEIKQKINDKNPLGDRYKAINSFHTWKAIREFEEKLNCEMDRMGLSFTRFDIVPKDAKLMMKYGIKLPEEMMEEIQNASQVEE